jgi:hypothetical protein
MQSTQPPKSTPPLKEADPHDVFAIESILAARADHRAPPLAHDASHDPVGPQASAAAPQVQIAPEIRPDMGASAPPVVPTSRATDIQVENNRPAEIRVDDLMPLTERPTSKWGKRIVMGLLGLCSAIVAAAWQHYGDHAKAMAVSWTPQSVVAALSPSETPPAAQPASAPVIQAAVPDQTATTEQPGVQPAALATSEQAAAPATVPSAESGQLQSMAQDLAAMTRQVEELKASIAQLRTSHAQMAREVAKATEARASEARPPEQAARPRVAAVPSVPPPRAAAPPARKPPPAQATYIPPVQPLPPPPAPVQAQPAPPPQLADDGAPVVRPPMPLR